MQPFHSTVCFSERGKEGLEGKKKPADIHHLAIRQAAFLPTGSASAGASFIRDTERLRLARPSYASAWDDITLLCGRRGSRVWGLPLSAHYGLLAASRKLCTYSHKPLKLQKWTKAHSEWRIKMTRPFHCGRRVVVKTAFKKMSLLSVGNNHQYLANRGWAGAVSPSSRSIWLSLACRRPIITFEYFMDASHDSLQTKRSLKLSLKAFGGSHGLPTVQTLLAPLYFCTLIILKFKMQQSCQTPVQRPAHC